MGTLRYCDWCKDEIGAISNNTVEYHTKFDSGFTTTDQVCSTCQNAHLAFIKSIKQNRKPRICYK